MNKMIVNVPSKIRYISEWNDFDLNNFSGHYILNKNLSGCGFTNYCIESKENIIILSPRKLLLENKKSQYPGVFYFRNEYEVDVIEDFKNIDTIDTEPNKKERKLITKLKKDVIDYCSNCEGPCKILVTYDSFKYVREALGDSINYFKVIVDEAQYIISDTKIKVNTELDLLCQLDDINHVCFVFNTSELDRYLEIMDEFKDLPYYELNWGKEIKPTINTKIIPGDESIEAEVGTIIQDYLDGKFVNKGGVESREAVFFVSSIKSIVRIIKKYGLTFDNTNVFCARISEGKTEERLLEIFGLTKETLKDKYGVDSCIGNIPKKGEPHKMFTFCTLTVYCGIDFYSTNARTFIFLDSSLDYPIIDISIDLPQILGRQRLDMNPWKNSIEIFIRESFIMEKPDMERFNEYLERKIKETENLLSIYNQIVNLKEKISLLRTILVAISANLYKDDYVAVNKYSCPFFNKLMLVSDIRSFEIKQIDYKDQVLDF